MLLLTLIRSSTRDDLNIQSSLTSSFSSRSSRLPLEQNSVTMANTQQSWKKPRKGLTFSWRMSFICKEKDEQISVICRVFWTIYFQTFCFADAPVQKHRWFWGWCCQTSHRGASSATPSRPGGERTPNEGWIRKDCCFPYGSSYISEIILVLFWLSGKFLSVKGIFRSKFNRWSNTPWNCVRLPLEKSSLQTAS